MIPAGWWRAARVVAVKETRSAFRDRQTRMYTLLMPLVMYPVMFWVALQAMTLVDGLREARTVSVAVVASDDGAADRADPLRDALRDDALDQVVQLARYESLLERGGRDDAGDDAAAAAREAALLAELEPRTRYTPDAAGADAVLRVPAQGELVLEYDASRSASRLARDRVEDALERLIELRRAEALGMPVAELVPLDFERRDLAEDADRGAFVLSTMLPLMLVAMATMGAFFPAVDITAGERERKTFETTLLLPVPRTAVFTGQLISVAIAALAATAMNLVGIMLAAGHLLSMLTDEIEITLPLTSAALMLPVMVTFALFLAATLTAFASFTETFKQGQALLGSVQMVFILPALASTLPGIQLTLGVAVIPVVGPSVALREILRAGGDPSALPLVPLLVCLGTSALLAALAVALAVRAMRGERAGVPTWVAKLTGQGASKS